MCFLRVSLDKNNKSPGSDLFSHTLASAVSSALGRFTSVFGMGTGGAASLEPPGERIYVIFITSHTRCERSASKSIHPYHHLVNVQSCPQIHRLAVSRSLWGLAATSAAGMRTGYNPPGRKFRSLVGSFVPQEPMSWHLRPKEDIAVPGSLSQPPRLAGR